MNNKKKNRKQIVFYLVSILLCIGASAFGDSSPIPTQLTTGLEQVRNALTGDLARTIIGICFVGSCIAYAYNKDNEKMKSKVLAVMIASGMLGMGQALVDWAAGMGTGS
jgi:type IV secretory pathway VirB2 component (pilin)